MSKADRIYDIAEKLGYEGDTEGSTSDAINAVSDALGFVGPHARRITDALSDLYTVVSGGGGGGGDFDTVTVTLTTAVDASIKIYPMPYIFDDELLTATITLGHGASKTCEFVTYKGNPTSFEFSGGTATASGDAEVDEDAVIISGDCSISFAS